MNGKQPLDVHYTNTGDPYTVTDNFIALFEGLDHVNSDLALAEALQDQESAYWSLQTSSNKQGNIASTSKSSYSGHNQNNEGVLYGTRDITRIQDDQLQLRNDEALARALQEVETEAEDHNNNDHLIPVARMEDRIREHHDVSNNSQAATQDNVDPDYMSYEDLLALGDAVGTHSRGLSKQLIDSLPSSKYKTKLFSRNNKNDLCVICHMDYKRGDRLITLPCKHPYHANCITQWLQINKACPICYVEVFESKGKKCKE